MLNRQKFTLLCALLVLGAFAPHARALEPIRPPFGLTWGETEDHMEKLLKGAKATVVERRNIRGREVWDVEGLVQNGLKRTLFYFRNGELVEVELQYQKDEWQPDKYFEFMGQVRQRLDQRFGEGQKLAERRESAGEVMQDVQSWKWNSNNAVVELVYYSAEDDSRIFRTLSVHYRVN